MDPRMAARRVRVAEGRAKSELTRLLWLAGTAAMIGGVIWLLTSPILSVQRIVLYGVEHGSVTEILATEGVSEGRPLITIRSDQVAERLEEDPWISAASVELIFPNMVEVTVAERQSAAWIQIDGRWAHVASDGVVVAYAAAPPTGAPVVRFAASDPGLGQVIEDPQAVGAVAFIGALPVDLASGVEIRMDAGEVWATVRDRAVRLGTSADMVAKAAAVAAVINLSDEGVIDVIAPARPAVWAQGALVETGGVNAQDEVEREG